MSAERGLGLKVARRPGRWAVGVFVMAVVWGSPGVVHGQGVAPRATSSEPDAADVKRAEELFRKGGEHYAAKRYAEAEAAYLEAWSIKKTFDIASNLGHTEVQLGKLKEAARHFQYALRNWPFSGKAEPRELAEKRYLEVRGKVGSIRVRVSVRGARVRVGEEEVGESPMDDEVFVDPGATKVTATLSGYKGAEMMVEAKAGGVHEAVLALEKAEEKKPGNGKVGHGKAEGSTGEALRLGVLIGGAALGAVGLGVGIGATVHSNAKSEEAGLIVQELYARDGRDACVLPSNQPRCDDLTSASDARATFRGLAIGSFLVGGAAAAGTVVYAIVSRPKVSDRKQERSVQAAFSVTPGGGGVVVRGSF